MTVSIGTPTTTTPTLQWTYLKLVNRLARECGLLRVDSIDSVQNQSGLQLLLCEWIQSAWIEIQERHPNWGWMRKTTTFATVDGQAIYTPEACGITAGQFKEWVRHSFRVYPTSAPAGETILFDRAYDWWRNVYQLGANRTTKSRPVVVAVTPAKELALGPVPLAGYTVEAQYWKAPQVLLNDQDVPEVPSGHDPLMIVYQAMISDGYYGAKAEVLGRAREKLPTILNKLEMAYLPPIALGPTLAT